MPLFLFRNSRLPTSPTTLRTHLQTIFNYLHQPQSYHPTRRRFLTLHDPRYLSRSRLPKLRFPRRTNTTNSTSTSRPSPDPTSHLGSPSPSESSLSLSQRLRKLSREYGWSAVGIYFLLSALDFPFCFAAVRLLGTERIGHWEHVVVGALWRVVTLDGRLGDQSKDEGTAESQGHGQDENEGKKVTSITEDGLHRIGQQVEGEGGGITAVAVHGGQVIEQAKEGQGWSWGVEEAQVEADKSGATIWTQLALAYAIHKSFIFLRVPATVAVTPKVVRVLRGWGWDIGKRRPKTTAGGIKNVKSSNSSGAGKGSEVD